MNYKIGDKNVFFKNRNFFFFQKNFDERGEEENFLQHVAACEEIFLCECDFKIKFKIKWKSEKLSEKFFE